MAERLTRGEHIERAAELLRGTDETLLGGVLDQHYPPSQRDVLESIAHSLIAEVLGQRSDAGEPASRWAAFTGDSHIRVVDGQSWQLVGGNPMDPGWFVFGPGRKVTGRYVGDDLESAFAGADRLIAEHQAGQP